MDERKKRTMVQAVLCQQLAAFKQKNAISASMMEDAINKYLVLLKEDLMIEYINSTLEQQNQKEEEENNG